MRLQIQNQILIKSAWISTSTTTIIMKPPVLSYLVVQSRFRADMVCLILRKIKIIHVSPSRIAALWCSLSEEERWRWCWCWCWWDIKSEAAAALLPPAPWTRTSQLGSLSANDDGPVDFSHPDALTRLLLSGGTFKSEGEMDHPGKWPLMKMLLMFLSVTPASFVVINTPKQSVRAQINLHLIYIC